MAKPNKETSGAFKDIGIGDAAPKPGAILSPTTPVKLERREGVTVEEAVAAAMGSLPQPDGTTMAPAAAAAQVASVPVGVTAPADGPRVKWVVEFDCPTGVAHPTLEVEAVNEEEAWKLFMKANGITASIYKPKIHRAEAA